MLGELKTLISRCISQYITSLPSLSMVHCTVQQQTRQTVEGEKGGRGYYGDRDMRGAGVCNALPFALRPAQRNTMLDSFSNIGNRTRGETNLRPCYPAADEGGQ